MIAAFIYGKRGAKEKKKDNGKVCAGDEYTFGKAELGTDNGRNDIGGGLEVGSRAIRNGRDDFVLGTEVVRWEGGK